MLAVSFPASVQLLHIPDGFLSLPVSLVCWLVTLLILSLAVRYTGHIFDESLAPLAGIMAAFVFAAQMLNFPVAGGTTGHLLGGVLVAITLGPWLGMLVMTAVIALQALLFQDGGLVVMGANILNMGLLTTLIGFGLFRSVAGRSRGLRLGTAAVAAWLSVMAGALATALQLWLSGTADLAFVVPAMLGVHVFIGVGEALITVAALGFIMQVQPALLGGSPKGGRGWIVPGFALALAVALLSPWAATDPDGLERVAADLGFMAAGVEVPYQILAGYTIPFLGETPLSTVLAGLAGAVLVAFLVVSLVRWLQRPTATG